jgi:hypothetical protein
MKAKLLLICAIALVGILASGCSVIATKDIDQAIGLATAAKDTNGIACLQAQKLIFGAEPIGFFTIMEQARLMQAALLVCSGVLPSALPVKP